MLKGAFLWTNTKGPQILPAKRSVCIQETSDLFPVPLIIRPIGCLLGADCYDRVTAVVNGISHSARYCGGVGLGRIKSRGGYC